MHNLINRVKKLEEKINVSDEEHLLFMVGTDGDDKNIYSITDIKRGNSMQNDTKLPLDEFLTHVESVWDIDIKTDYYNDKSDPIQWIGDRQNTIVLE